MVERRAILLTVVMGIVVALAAMIFAALTVHGSSLVLFSGMYQLPSLVANAGTFSVGALVLLVVCKGIAYTASLSSFRGGPIFPSMFIGAAGGIALSHLPGLPMVAGIAMGIGAMVAVMLGLPLTAVLLASVFVAADGLCARTAHHRGGLRRVRRLRASRAPRLRKSLRFRSRRLRRRKIDLRKEIPWPL